MAADYARLTRTLHDFYDFTGRTVLFVGAGTKQLFDTTTKTRKIVAIDKDDAALTDLRAMVAARGLEGAFDVVSARFEDVASPADVVYFEFCLHEMDDPEAVLAHAKSLAPDVVVFDHSPGSEWIYFGAEEQPVARSAGAMVRTGIRRRQQIRAEQRFRDHAELLDKIRQQGPTAIDRARRFAGATGIVIPMDCELNLL